MRKEDFSFFIAKVQLFYEKVNSKVML